MPSRPPTTASGTSPLPLPLVRRGKVREMYDLGPGLLLMVASDRISAFDVVMDCPVPGKGRVLTALSAFWLRRLAGVVDTHLVSDDIAGLADAGGMDADVADVLRASAETLAGRALVVRRAERIDIECVVRGYLAGSAWAEYRRAGTVAEEPLPPGLVEADRLERPIFTPATKADSGHDENISRARLRGLVGADLAERLERTSLALYLEAERHARERGLILADTKFEFGLLDGHLLLIDEALTPDSSRYWPADAYRPGGPQPSFDKQYLRDYLEASGWNKRPPPPPLPEEVVRVTAEKYGEALRRLTAP